MRFNVNNELVDKILYHHNNVMCKRNIIICINVECAVDSVRTGDIYYAQYLPTTSATIRDILYKYELSTGLKPEEEEDPIAWFYSLTMIRDGFGFSSNAALKVQILGSEKVHNILSNEYSVVTEEKLNSWIDAGIYDFVKFHNPSEQERPDNKQGFIFLDGEQTDIFGAAILDGASPSDAWAVSIGMDVSSDELNIKPLDGFFTLKDEYQLVIREKTKLVFAD